MTGSDKVNNLRHGQPASQQRQQLMPRWIQAVLSHRPHQTIGPGRPLVMPTYSLMGGFVLETRTRTSALRPRQSISLSVQFRRDLIDDPSRLGQVFALDLCDYIISLSVLSEKRKGYEP